jgi:hypothetical protein
MGRKSKLKKQRKTANDSKLPPLNKPRGDIETLTHLGYGEHNRLRSPDIPADRPEPQV